MIRKIKDVYNNYNYFGCDGYKNCATCVEYYYNRWWFENGSTFGTDDKLPMITYEY